MIKTNKKAQITTFIIIGIIILIGVLVYIGIRSSKLPTEKEVERVIAEVPVEFQPINDFVQSCIAKTGKDAIKAIGLHGGYIDLKLYGISANAADPTDKGAFLFNRNDPTSSIAYWNYFKSNNLCEEDCECGSEQPYLRKKDGAPNFETQIEKYVDEHLETCLNKFDSFKRQGFIVTPKGKIKTTATIRDSDVLFIVDYPLDVKKESEFNIEMFMAKSNINLPRIYDLASQIKESQKNTSYIEKWTMELISGFGLGLNSNKLPPLAASELDPMKSPVYWVKEDVKQDIMKDVLPGYIAMMTVSDTKNYNLDILGTFYERAVLPIESNSGYDYTDLEVRFNYVSWWPVYLDITGRGIKGQRIGPETASVSFFPFIGIKKYNFYYDLSYPVVVRLSDSSAFNNEGYEFYFGLESNVRNNKPINCTGPGITNYATPTGTLFCNPEQGCADVLIETIDAKTNKPLENVTIYYSAGKESCDKGFTELKDNKASLKTSLPQCVGSACAINAVKDGYWTYPITAAVRCETSNICSETNVLCNNEGIQLKLEPYRNNDITIMKKKMLKTAQKIWAFNNVEEPLLENEFAVISLTKIPSDINEQQLSVAGIYYGNQKNFTLNPGLVPGNYELEINLFYKLPDKKGRDIVVFKEVEECEDTMLGLDEECTTIGPYNMTDTIAEGGFTANITLAKEMLDNSNNLVFYAVGSPDIDTSYDVLDVYDMDELGKIDEYSEKYKVDLKPIAR